MSDEKIAYRKMNVKEQAVSLAADALLDELNGVKRMLQGTRITAQKELERDSPGAVQAQENAIKDINARNLSYMKAKPLISKARHAIGDPIVFKFEKAYLSTRVTADAVLLKLKNFKYPDCGIESVNETGCVAVYITPKEGTREKALELYLGKDRFSPPDDATGVMKHKTNGREYVPDRYDVCISRYVIRGLNKADRARIDKGDNPSIIATGGVRPAEETALTEAIFEHCRNKSKAKGGTFFISVSHTKHKVTGSTGAVFGNSESGSAIIDLSKVPKADRVDLHSPEAVARIFGVNKIDVELKKPGSGAKNAAKRERWDDNATARDVVRTREILVLEKVPPAAVLAVRLGATGAWYGLNAENKPDTTKAATLPSGIPAEWTA